VLLQTIQPVVANVSLDCSCVGGCPELVLNKVLSIYVVSLQRLTRILCHDPVGTPLSWFVGTVIRVSFSPNSRGSEFESTGTSLAGGDHIFAYSMNHGLSPVTN
jgi:hypothetical protein